MTWQRCCEPKRMDDGELRHAKNCAIEAYRFRKLSIVEESDLREFRILRSAGRLPSLDELAASVESHPSRHGLRLAPGYIDAHSDDDDDSEVSW